MVPGQKLGHLRMIRVAEKPKFSRSHKLTGWAELECDCGRVVVRHTSPIVTGRARSCGCGSQSAVRARNRASVAESFALKRARGGR